jgi:hypothetical protein
MALEDHQLSAAGKIDDPRGIVGAGHHALVVRQ